MIFFDPAILDISIRAFIVLLVLISILNGDDVGKDFTQILCIGKIISKVHKGRMI